MLATRIYFLLLKDDFVCNIATYCGFFFLSKLFIPTSSVYLIRLLFFVQIHTFVTFIWSNHIHLRVTCFCRRNASAFGNGSRFLSASIFEHLPHHVLRKWFLSAAKGVQSKNKWHWIGGWSGMGRSLCTVHSQQVIKPLLKSSLLSREVITWSSCIAILIVCTSFDSQRRAVHKWKQSRSCQGTISFILCVFV